MKKQLYLRPPDGTKGLSLFLIPKFLVGPAGNFQQKSREFQGNFANVDDRSWQKGPDDWHHSADRRTSGRKGLIKASRTFDGFRLGPANQTGIERKGAFPIARVEARASRCGRARPAALVPAVDRCWVQTA